jgi:2-phosphoglycerate kinase
MIYLIGGPPRVGKSTIANILLEKSNIAFIDTDWIVHMLMFASPNSGVATYKNLILDEFINKAEKFYPYLYQFIKYNQPVVNRYLIEGDVILPKYITQLNKEFETRSVFLGTSYLTSEILLNNPSSNDWWIKKMTNEDLEKLCRYVVEISEYLANECDKYKLNYIDVNKNYKLEINKAADILLNNSEVD